MLATLGGYLALLLGLALLLLPLLATELSRPRDSVWGAVVLLLGLVLVTSAERLSGAPMLGVLCGGLLIGRLGLEVGQGRWRLLSEEEQRRLWSQERWQTSLSQAGAALAQLLARASQVSAGLASWLAERRQSAPATSKRWVRPEPEIPAEPAEAASDSDGTPESGGDAESDSNAATTDSAEEAANTPAVIEVSSFAEIDALIEAAEPEPSATEPASSSDTPTEAGRSEAG